MGRMENDITNIMALTALTEEQQINMIFALHIRFNKIELTLVLSNALQAKDAPVPRPPAPAVLPKFQANIGIVL